MKIKQIFFTIIYWTWCLPQSLLGALVYGFVKLVDRDIEEFRYKTGAWIVRTEKLGAGVSLGYFIFSYDYEDAQESKGLPYSQWHKDAQERMDRHEWGHTLQGFLLGPLYLFVIGIPSFVWASFYKKYRKENNVSYYSFYPEKWADKWGKVKRSV